jgi:hypothetical protein
MLSLIMSDTEFCVVLGDTLWGLTWVKQKDRRTAMICAAAFGRLECMLLLVEAGADKEVKDSVRSM